MRTLSIDQILALHDTLCARTGGEVSLRDVGLLESALFSVQQTFMGEELYPTPIEKGARLGYALIKNHAFVDANKRIGVLCMLVYLSLMGIRPALTSEDVVHIGLGVASGELGYEELVSLIRARTRMPDGV